MCETEHESVSHKGNARHVLRSRLRGGNRDGIHLQPVNDFALAIAVANEGAAIVRDRFGSHLTRVDKGSGDFATNADIETEKAMSVLLRRERPDDCILGKEGGSSGTADSLRTWLNDPLCGTLKTAPHSPRQSLPPIPSSAFRPRAVSTTMALTWVATGQRAAYITDGDMRNSVHFAAGPAICAAPGCTVTNLRGQPCGAVQPLVWLLPATPTLMQRFCAS